MKQTELLQQLDSILTLLPTEQEVTVALRYEGTESLKRTIGDARRQLEELKARLSK